MVAGSGGTLIVNIAPAAPGTGSVTFSGTPVVTAPGSLGATATASGSTLTITLTGQDPLNVEQVTVSGLKISATINASLGAIVATLTGTARAAFVPGTVTATGTLQAALGTGAATVSVNVTSACGFDNTNANGGANFSDVSDARNITSGAGTGLQNIGFAAGASAHVIGTTVTQTVPNCAPTGLASPGTVADVVIENVPAGAASVNPGENNQFVSNVTATEQTAGYIGVGTLTFTLSPAGVLFSASPTVSATGAGFAIGTVCNLSFDRTSCTVSVTSASTAPAVVTLSNISLDVASSVAPGTSVNVAISGSPAINVSVTANTIAIVSRVIIGVAATPTIWINYNDQSTGTISLTEQGAGFFTAGLGGNNTFGLCLATGESFTRAPYAVVTVGDLKLLNGVVGGTSVLGTLMMDPDADAPCAYWTVYSASTVASTIEIRGSDSTGAVLPSGPNNGPRVSVPNNLQPGPTQMAINVGPLANMGEDNEGAFVGLVTNAIRAYKSGIVVTALSQPFIAPGTTGPAGNITIAETLNGQLQAGEVIECRILSPATNENQQTYLATATSNGLPIVSTNLATGLSAHLSDWWSTGFDITIDQQAFAPGLGVITVSNLNYTNVAGAITGPVTVECFRTTNNLGLPTQFAPRISISSGGVDFDSFISNAVIGTAPTLSIGALSALGVPPNQGSWSIATKLPARGQYVTWRFSGAVAGQNVQIWIAKKNSAGGWSAFSLLTSRTADASGNAYFHWRYSAAAWVSVRAYAGGAWSPARQAHWQ